MYPVRDYNGDPTAKSAMATDLLPAVIVLHPGAWSSGDKSWVFTPHDMNLASKGYVVFDIQYRFTQETLWPGQLDDCREAIRWVKANAAKYGVDPARIACLDPALDLEVLQRHLDSIVRICRGGPEAGRGPEAETDLLDDQSRLFPILLICLFRRAHHMSPGRPDDTRRPAIASFSGPEDRDLVRGQRAIVRDECTTFELRLRPGGPGSLVELDALLDTLFAQRRKQVGGILRRRLGLLPQEVEGVLAELGIDPERRPEELGGAELETLAAHPAWLGRRREGGGEA